MYGRSGLGQSATSEPAPELLRRANAVIDNGGVDLEATDLIRVARQPKPHVVDPQHRRALLIGDRVTQRLMPRRDVLSKSPALSLAVFLLTAAPFGGTWWGADLPGVVTRGQSPILRMWSPRLRSASAGVDSLPGPDENNVAEDDRNRTDLLTEVRAVLHLEVQVRHQ